MKKRKIPKLYIKEIYNCVQCPEFSDYEFFFCQRAEKYLGKDNGKYFNKYIEEIPEWCPLAEHYGL
jgi:hypothetical protein